MKFARVKRIYHTKVTLNDQLPNTFPQLQITNLPGFKWISRPREAMTRVKLGDWMTVDDSAGQHVNNPSVGIIRE